MSNDIKQILTNALELTFSEADLSVYLAEAAYVGFNPEKMIRAMLVKQPNKGKLLEDMKWFIIATIVKGPKVSVWNTANDKRPWPLRDAALADIRTTYSIRDNTSGLNARNKGSGDLVTAGRIQSTFAPITARILEAVPTDQIAKVVPVIEESLPQRFHFSGAPSIMSQKAWNDYGGAWMAWANKTAKTLSKGTQTEIQPAVVTALRTSTLWNEWKGKFD